MNDRRKIVIRRITGWRVGCLAVATMGMAAAGAAASGSIAVATSAAATGVAKISSVTPANGAAGSRIILTGSQFTGTGTVSFAGVASTAWSIVSDTQISVVVPPGSGAAGVAVTNAAGTSVASSTDVFTYGAGTTTTPASSDPSGVSPPATPAGYSLSDLEEFNGTTLPSGWQAFAGQPGGDPYGWEDAANLTVSGGELHFGTSWDAAKGMYSSAGAYDGVVLQTYGEYLVRMKSDNNTGMTFDNNVLLWPVANVWPPEIDFYEDDGGARSSMAATLHPGPNGDNIDQIQNPLVVDGTQWHTYGVIWTATSLTYTVDGEVWATVQKSQLAAGAVWPSQDMTLNMQSENLGSVQPSAPTETMTVDWVAVYSAS